MMSTKQKLIDLYAAIKKYYILDKTYNVTTDAEIPYDLHDDIRLIVREKCDAISENRPPVNVISFYKEVDHEFSKNYQFIPQSFLQFPNYACTIVLKEYTLGNHRFRILLKVSVSLLCNFFTVFFQQEVSFEGLEYQYMENQKTDVFIAQIISDHISEHDPDSKIFHKLVDITAKAFPGHQQLYHKDVFNYVVDFGLPYGSILPPGSNYPIFNYLFNMDLIKGSYLTERPFEWKIDQIVSTL